MQNPFQQEGTLMIWPWTYAGHFYAEGGKQQRTNRESVTVCTGILPTTSCFEPWSKR